MIAMYAPDALHHWGIGVDSKGTEEFAAALDPFFTAFPDSHSMINQV